MKWRGFFALWLLLSGVSGSSVAEDRWFVDQNLVYERGSELSHTYLQKHAPDFSGKLEGLKRWIVRIEVKHSFSDNGFSSNHGTGVILKDGLVLTAGHVLTDNVKDGKIEILLTSIDGRVFPAEVEKRGKKDWALLCLTVEKDRELVVDSPVAMGKAADGDTVVFFGYPARLGLDANGKVQSFHKGDEEKEIPVSRLSPMPVVLSVADADGMTLTPLAGFPPTGGMSGGPVFNLKGEVIGEQISVSKTTEDATGKVLRYAVDAVPAGAVRGR